MRASVTTDTGDLDVVEIREVPKPEVGPTDVLVEVGASAVNYVDIWLRQGMEGDVPRVTGVDVAGEVVEAGADADRDVGDRVVLYWNTTHCGRCEHCLHGDITMCPDYGGLGISRDGGHAEYVAVDSRFAVPIPDDIPFTEAAAFPTGFGTAWRALVTRADVDQGEDVLVTGASGSVGHAAVQVATEAGARVIACTSADWKADRLRELGADHVIDYTDVALEEAVDEVTDGRGVDVVLESIGGDTYRRGVQSLVRGGRLVTFGATTGDAEAAMLPHVFWKQLEVIGSTGATLGEFHDVVDRYRDGAFQPVVDSVISLEELPDAQRKLADRGVFGKIVVEP
jgi:NADPH:quinone reductase-like Zn-dependent oxidoreductase